jgi:hypothetical protein
MSQLLFDGSYLKANKLLLIPEVTELLKHAHGPIYPLLILRSKNMGPTNIPSLFEKSVLVQATTIPADRIDDKAPTIQLIKWRAQHANLLVFEMDTSNLENFTGTKYAILCLFVMIKSLIMIITTENNAENKDVMEIIAHCPTNLHQASVWYWECASESTSARKETNVWDDLKLGYLAYKLHSSPAISIIPDSTSEEFIQTKIENEIVNKACWFLENICCLKKDRQMLDGENLLAIFYSFADEYNYSKKISVIDLDHQRSVKHQQQTDTSPHPVIEMSLLSPQPKLQGEVSH